MGAGPLATLVSKALAAALVRGISPWGSSDLPVGLDLLLVDEAGVDSIYDSEPCRPSLAMLRAPQGAHLWLARG